MNIGDLKEKYKVSFRTRGIKKYATLRGMEQYREMCEDVSSIWPESRCTSFGSGRGGTFRLNPDDV